MAEIIGYFGQSVIDLLNLPDLTKHTPIFIGEGNVEHIKNRHPYEYEKYFPDLAEIISAPDYVGINPSDSSISFVKEYLVSSEYIKVAVRITKKGKYFVKSLHLLSTCNAERYIEYGSLKRLDTQNK